MSFEYEQYTVEQFCLGTHGIIEVFWHVVDQHSVREETVKVFEENDRAKAERYARKLNREAKV